MSHNNNRNYFEVSSLVSVYANSIFTHFRFCQAVGRIEKCPYLCNDKSNFGKKWRFFLFL